MRFSLDFLKRKPQKQGSRTGQIVFREPFIIESIRIEKREIANYIRGKAFLMFNDDYYYAYTYTNGILSFVVVNSGDHDVGNFSMFTPAFLSPGLYYYHAVENNKYFFIENSAGFLKAELAYDEREGYQNLELCQIPSDVPKTLAFQWSLKKMRINVSGVLMVIFACSMLFLFFSVFKLRDVDAAVKAKLPQIMALKEPDSPAQSNKLPDLVIALKKVGDMVAGQGVVKKVDLQAQTRKINFHIVFDKEYYAQAFVQKTGGKYENNEVIYTTDFFGNR